MLKVRSGLVVALLAQAALSCTRAESAQKNSGASGSLNLAAPAQPDLARARLLTQVSNGRAQGPVAPANLAQASVMILIDSFQGEACVAYRVADVLQRAGYSVWPYFNPDLEGSSVLLYPSRRAGQNELTLQGGWGSEDVTATITLTHSGATSNHDQRDIEFLAAKLLDSPGFRARVGRMTADESAGHFITSPIPPEQIRGLCLVQSQASPKR